MAAGPAQPHAGLGRSFTVAAGAPELRQACK